MVKPNRKKQKDDNLKRRNRATICFNNHELAAINKFCNKYRVNNKSKFMREAIITEILKKFDELEKIKPFTDMGKISTVNVDAQNNYIFERYP